MKKSPLKQLDQNTQLKIHQEEGAFKAGNAILSENQKRKNWEELQVTIDMLDSDAKKLRKHKDKLLLEDEKKIAENAAMVLMPPNFLNA